MSELSSQDTTLLELEMAAWELDDFQLNQLLVIVGRELGRRGLGEWQEHDNGG